MTKINSKKRITTPKYKNLPKYKTIQEKYLKDLNDSWSAIEYDNKSWTLNYDAEYDEWANQTINYSFKSKFEFRVGDLVFIKTTRPYSFIGGSSVSLGSSVYVPYVQTNPGLGTTTPPRTAMPSTAIPAGTGVPTTTIAPTTVTSPTGWQVAYPTQIGNTTGKLGMALLPNGTSVGGTVKITAAPKMSTMVYSSSMVTYYKPQQVGISTSGTATLTDEFVANGYRTIDDLLRSRDPISIKQEATWTDEEKKEMATSKTNTFWRGKPFIGIVVDRYIPKNTTDNVEEVTALGESGQMLDAYKVLFDENHCYWFRGIELFPTKKKEADK